MNARSILISKKKNAGPVRDWNPAALAPKARIIPLDQLAVFDKTCLVQKYHCASELYMAIPQIQ